MSKPKVEWTAFYSDRTSLPQFNDDGSENKFKDIDRAKLICFALYFDGEMKICLHLGPGMRLIHRRRIAKHVMGPKAGTQDIVYILGWQETRRGVNFQALHFVFEDGHVESTNRFYEKHNWFYPLTLQPWET
jgi:hypothetical protein